jgi:hypothetical protein
MGAEGLKSELVITPVEQQLSRHLQLHYKSTAVCQYYIRFRGFPPVSIKVVFEVDDALKPDLIRNT